MNSFENLVKSVMNINNNDLFEKMVQNRMILLLFFCTSKVMIICRSFKKPQSIKKIQRLIKYTMILTHISNIF